LLHKIKKKTKAGKKKNEDKLKPIEIKIGNEMDINAI
jgi:hypothetical protein